MPLPPGALSFNDLGSEKVDYSAVVDSSTDRSAVEVNTAFAAIAQLTRTAIKAFLVFSGASGVPTVTSNDAVWGNTSPVITHPNLGIYVITYPASVTDPLGNTVSVSFKSVQVSLGGDLGAFVNADVTAPNVITIYGFDETAVTSNLIDVPIHCWII